MMKKAGSFLFAVIGVFFISSLFYVSSSAADLPQIKLAAAKTTESEVTLGWAKVKGAQGYKIYVLSNSGKYEAVGATTALKYTVKKLKANTTYSFKVKPFIKNKDGSRDFGDPSDAFKAKTKLKKVTGLKAASATSSSITVSWKGVAGAQYYRVQYRQKNSSSYKIAGETTGTKFTIKGLDTKGYYRIRVCAKCKGNTSSYCDSAVFYTVPERLKRPVLVSRNSNKIKISWEKKGPSNAYYVYVAASANGKYKKVAGVTGRTYIYKAGKPSTSYWFRVAPVIKTDKQVLVGKQSSALKASTANLQITAPKTLKKGEHPSIKVSYYNKNVKWTSSNSKIVKVNGQNFYACGTGKVTLTAKYKNAKKSIKYNVTSPVVNVMSCVYDFTNNRYIFENRKNERCYPASITKLITALVALKYMNVNDTIVVGNELNMVEALSSRCGIQKGEKFRLGDLLYGLLLPSGGDAAYTIAVNCARKVSGKPNMGYVDAKNYFVSLMNKYMTSIGATRTHCVNPHGYPVNGHYSTVNDLVLVAKNVLKNKTLSKITSTSSKYVTALTGRGRTWTTTNSLIKSGSSYYSPYACGMKTGTVDDNYTGIVSAAKRNKTTYITVVIGCESYAARYQKTKTLYDRYIL